MRFAIPLFTLFFLVSACQHTEQTLKWPDQSEIRCFLVGTWSSETPMSASVTFYADGRFESTSTSSPTVRGTWKDFRPDGSVIRVSAEGRSQPEIYTIRHVDVHLLVLLPPYATVLPPQTPLRFTR